jgi:hypothetical protein
MIVTIYFSVWGTKVPTESIGVLTRYNPRETVSHPTATIR